MSAREWQFRIEDILQSLAGIASDINRLNYKDFLQDRKTRNSVARELEIIGEAARHIPPDIVARYPQIPWRLMRDMRNVIAHEYFGVDWQIIWETATNDLPFLVPFLQAILEDWKD
jgi:uncharacterized protein with HEPN domain